MGGGRLSALGDQETAVVTGHWTALPRYQLCAISSREPDSVRAVIPVAAGARQKAA